MPAEPRIDPDQAADLTTRRDAIAASCALPGVVAVGTDACDSRHFGPGAVARCAKAEAALNAAVTAAGTWVDGDTIAENWSDVHSAPVPADVSGRWQRALAPALAAGRVCARRHGRHVYYAPACRSGICMPELGSDLERIERALERAVARLGGAVPVEAVECEIESDPKLALDTVTPVAVRLSSLERCKRVTGIRPTAAARGLRGRVYYTTADAERRVASAAELQMDRRVRCIQAFWRAVERRPFTTRAVVTFSKTRDHFRVENDTRYGWTNAMQQLEHTGLLVCADPTEGDPYFARWAIRGDWEQMSPEQRMDRLRDTYGRDVEGYAAHPVERDSSWEHDARPGPAEHAARFDVAQISRNRDARALVQLATEWRDKQSADDVRREIVAQRPISLPDVKGVIAAGSRLVGPSITLARMLSEASRVRDGMVCPAVVRVGCVRNIAYYARDDTPAGRHYVRYVALRAMVDLPPIARATSALRDALDLAAAGVLPLAGGLVEARLTQIEAEITSDWCSFKRAASTAKRLPEEILVDEELASEVGLIEGRLLAMRKLIKGAEPPRISCALSCGPRAERDTDLALDQRYMGTASERRWQMTPGALLDIREAAAQLEGLTSYHMQSSRALWARIYQSVRVIRIRETETTDFEIGPPVGGRDCDQATFVGKCDSNTDFDSPHSRRGDASDYSPTTVGRQVTTYLDRVGFGVYATLRWGGPLLSTFASQGAHALGELRCSERLCAILETPTPTNTHACTVAALGLLDDLTARTALARYICGVCSGEVHSSVVALALACYGLAPRPIGGLAKVLTPIERSALEVAARHQDDFTRKTASRALRAWDESWGRDALLVL